MDAAGIILSGALVASALAFGLALFDKARARRPGRRVPEATLLLAALLGGSPGLVAGMLAARHKVRKRSFLAKLLLVVSAQAAALWLALATGLL